MAISQEDVQSQLDNAIQKERQWRVHFDKQDHGSYCESASAECRKVRVVYQAWQTLIATLTKYDREH